MAVPCQTAWLEEFFTLLLENRNWITTELPGRIIRNNTEVSERRYFPTTSYNRLMEWREDCHGAIGSDTRHFRHFLTNYRESNLLYSKMMYTQVLVNQVRGDKYRKKSAREELWKGQNHNPVLAWT